MDGVRKIAISAPVQYDPKKRSQVPFQILGGEISCFRPKVSDLEPKNFLIVDCFGRFLIFRQFSKACSNIENRSAF